MSSTASLRQRLQQSSELKIGLIGAMDQEIDRLKASIDKVTVEVIAGFEFYSGQIGGVDVVLLKSGIGKVNAAIGTSLLIDRYAPTCIINTGSAGGFDPELQVGDLVISDEVRHHDVDLTVFGYEMGQCARMPAAYASDPLMIELAEAQIGKIAAVNTKRGLIATGDTFMSDPVRVDEVRKHFPQMKAVEMEAAAIAQTCYRFDLPFVIIRSLSDIAGQNSDVSFEAFLETASENSAQLVLSLVAALAAARG